MMKFIRIFLLALIIIGIGLLLTRDRWVPNVVEYILSSEGGSATINTEPTSSIKTTSQMCFIYKHKATETEPYSVEEYVILNISGAKVTGEKSGIQEGPDMMNSYQGTLEGEVKEDNRLELLFSYAIEGSENKELEVYKFEGDSLAKLRWPLKEEKGMLVPDRIGEPKVLVYIKEACK